MDEGIFSRRARRMIPSEIREILKIIQRPGIISFAGGLPAPESFPVQDIREIVDLMLEDKAEAYRALQYDITEGYVPLREEIAERMTGRRGISVSSDDILVTTGSQQALDLLARVLLDPGDLVVTGMPTYLGAVTSIDAYEGRLHSIPLDDYGIFPDRLRHELEHLYTSRGRAKFIYIMPTFHNPAGLCMDRKRRREIYDIASEFDTLIVEDDPYFELRYSGEEVPPIKSLDVEDRVIYLSTFSKILTPGFRLGWCIAPDPILKKMTIAKQSADVCTNVFSQHIAYYYLAKGYVDTHMEKVNTLYKTKRDTMLHTMDECFPTEVKWTRPDGGMFLWAELPSGVDTKKMLHRAVEKGVAYVSGKAFFPYARGGENCMRLNFSYMNRDLICEGIRRLSDVISDEISCPTQVA